VAAAPIHEPNSPAQKNKMDLSQALSVFLFDWDDTLFPTSALTAQGPERLEEDLKALDSTVEELLLAALAVPRSRVVILTNANISWVHYAAENFFPKVNALLQGPNERLSLLSAHRGRDSLLEVGSQAYEDIVRRAKSEAVVPLAKSLLQHFTEMQAQSLQIISIGDQPHDLAAAHALRSLMAVEEECFVKTVLMKAMPTGVELLRELGTLRKSLASLVSMPRSFHQSMQARPTSSASKAPASTAQCAAIQAVPTPSKNIAHLP